MMHLVRAAARAVSSRERAARSPRADAGNVGVACHPARSVPSRPVNLRRPASWPSPATAAAALLLLLSASGAALADGRQTCLGPGIGRVLQGMVEAHAFTGVVPSGYRLERLDVKMDHLEMGYDDDAGPAVTVLLTVAGAGSAATPADAHGPHFEHRLVDARGHASGPTRDAMLRAALLVDQAIPAEDLATCGPPPSRLASKHFVALGAVAVMILAALGFGIVRRFRRPAPDA
jgi:hypothetical protein